ncbi:MAG: sulfatase-like hydrolase/transferase, partial [Acidobacteriota bacterium]
MSLLVVLACGGVNPTPEGGLEIDLIPEFANAQVQKPTHYLDIGTPEAYRHLVRGWRPGVPIPLPADRPRFGLWSRRDVSEVDFFVTRPGDLPLIFITRTRLGLEGPLDISVNGERLESHEIGVRFSQIETIIPESMLRMGRNRLLFQHPRSVKPRSYSKDTRLLFEYINFGPYQAPAPPDPRVDEAEGTLFVPFDVRVDFMLELPAGEAALALDQVRVRGPEGSRLKITWQAVDGGPRDRLPGAVEREIEGRESEVTVPFSSGEPSQGRLSFFALAPAGADTERQGVVIERPRLLLAQAPGDAAAAPGGVQLAGDATGSNRAATAVAATANAANPDAASSTRPNVFLFMVDTLRADSLGSYGYQKDVSPRIDRFAEQAFLFEDAQAQTPWTRASVGSVMTGLWSQIHGSLGDYDALPPQVSTLAELLGEAGYATGAVISNGNVAAAAGFAQGFGEYRMLNQPTPGFELTRATDVVELSKEWLDEAPAEEPLFLWALSVDPHAPYEAPEDLRIRYAPNSPRDLGSRESVHRITVREASHDPEEIDQLRALYDAEVAANDAAFGDFLDELQERG